MQASPPTAGRPDGRDVPTAAAVVCPRCGSASAPNHEYCLECGLRLPTVRGLIPRLGVAWRRRLPWYPGDWLWPTLLFLGLAAAGAAAAIYVSTRPGKPQTLVATSPPGQTVRVVATTRATSTGAPTATAPTNVSPSSTTPAAPPPPKQTRPLAWPSGRRGYTVVLASVPTARGKPAAREQARKAIGAGLTDVGILDSSDYSSLHPGYYVIFTGVRDSEAATAPDRRAAQTGGYAEAYSRQITP